MATLTLKRDFNILDIFDKSEDVLSALNRAKVVLNNTTTKTYFDYEYRISEIIKNKNTLLLPFFDSTNISTESDDDNIAKVTSEYVEKYFTIPLLSKALKHTLNYCYKTALYYKFKSLYLEPIMDAECTRMVHDVLNYMEEKPFIISVESAFSRMLTDNNHKLDKVISDIWDSLSKELNKCKFKFFYSKLDNTDIYEDTIRICGDFKMKDYFRLDETKMMKVKSNIEYSTSTDEYARLDLELNVESYPFAIIKLCKYFIKIAVLDFLKTEILQDFNKLYNDFTVERMKNEIEISFIRNAKVISDYTKKFDNIYQCDIDSYSKDCKTKFIDFSMSLNRVGYEKTLKTLTESGCGANESIISDLLLEEYNAIGQIESLNRDYTSSDGNMAVDAERLRSTFESIVSLYKQWNVSRNKIYLDFIGTEYFTYVASKRKDDKDIGYTTVEELAAGLINYVITSYPFEFKLIDKKTMIRLINETSSWSATQLKKRCVSNDMWDKLIMELIEFVGYTSAVFSRYNDLQKVFNDMVIGWKRAMKKNIEYYYSYNPINELADYLKSPKCLCGPEFIKFSE